MCTLIVPWSLQDSGNLAAVLYRTVSPTATIPPPLGMTGPVEHMGPVGICPYKLLAENWLLFGTTYLKKVSIPCGPSMMELLESHRKPTRNPWQSSSKSVVFRDLNQPSKSRTINTNHLFWLSKTCCSRFQGGFLRVTGYYIIDGQHQGM